MEEKPIECSGCKKQPHITYKAMQSGKIVVISFCADCPILQKKLGLSTIHPSLKEESLSCIHCHTDLQAVMTGKGLGCANCYSVFEDVLLQELSNVDALPIDPSSPMATKKHLSLHLGHSPDKILHQGFSNQIESLNTALNEALTLESYERAANIRDQIKTLLEKPHE